jgi:hypothetical protein
MNVRDVLEMETYLEDPLAGVTGEEFKREGQERVENNNPRFVDLVRAKAREIVRERGVVWVDELRTWAAESGLEPKHCNAWGAVFKGEEWESCGMQKSAVPSNRARMVRVWRLKGGA